MTKCGSQSLDIEVKYSVKPPLCHFIRVICSHNSWKFQQKRLIRKTIKLSILYGKRTKYIAVGIIRSHSNIMSMTSQWDGDDTDCCWFYQDEKNSKTVKYLLWHCPTLSSSSASQMIKVAKGDRIISRRGLQNCFSFFNVFSSTQDEHNGPTSL